MKTPDATPTAATLRFAPPYSQRSSSLLSFSGPWKSKQSVIFKNAAQSRRGEMSKKKKKTKRTGPMRLWTLQESEKYKMYWSRYTHTRTQKHMAVALCCSCSLSLAPTANGMQLWKIDERDFGWRQSSKSANGSAVRCVISRDWHWMKGGCWLVSP